MDVNKVINDIFKVILNTILVLMAVFSIVNIFTNSHLTTWEICVRVLIVGLCGFTVWSRRYRYVGASLLLLLICTTYLLAK